MGSAIDTKNAVDRMYVQEIRLDFFVKRGDLDAVQRLCVDYEKYCILYWLKMEHTHGTKEVKRELLLKFKQQYKRAVSGKEISFRDRCILFLFWLFSVFSDNVW